MADQPDPPAAPREQPDCGVPFVEIAQRSQLILDDWMREHANAMRDASDASLNFTSMFLDVTAQLMSLPAAMASAQMSLWQQYFSAWQDTTSRMLAQALSRTLGPETFQPAMNAGVALYQDILSYLKQCHLLTWVWLQQTAGEPAAPSSATGRGIDPFCQQFLGALSPETFALRNPELVRSTLETGGENLITGLNNLLRDLDGGPECPSSAPFVVGKTVAATEGKVIFRNDIMELIQYAPLTPRVRRRPVLFVTPWVYKYYLVDLRADTSWIRWTIEQGHTVFLISWADGHGPAGGRSFEDYVLQGPVAALDVISEITGERTVDAVGNCAGGTLLAVVLGYLAAAGERRIASASFVTSLLDFSQPGEMGAVIDDDVLTEPRSGAAAVVDDIDAVASSLTKLRENDVIWSFVVNNYLLGHDPFPADLFHWNGDQVGLPARMHADFLRDLRRDNKLAEPGGLRIGSRTIDLGRVTTPNYILAAREDLLAPWRSSYRGLRLLGGSSRFTLAASGHATALVNPPTTHRYCYWVNGRTPATPEEWLAGARALEGSWWPDWNVWLFRVSGADWVDARVPGVGPFPALDDAPGAYVTGAAVTAASMTGTSVSGAAMTGVGG